MKLKSLTKDNETVENTIFVQESRGRMIKNPATFSRSTGFKSQPAGPLL